MDSSILGHDLLATVMPAASSGGQYMLNSFVDWLFHAIIFTGIGVLIGWLLWRHCRARVAEIKRENEKLLAEYEAEDKRVKELEDRVTMFEKA